jgi:hypothetical protein
MKTRTRVLLLGTVLAGPCLALLAAPSALAAIASGPALMTHGGDAPAHTGYRAITTAAGTSKMPGWEIALIVIAAALVISIGDRVLTRARAARRALVG